MKTVANFLRRKRWEKEEEEEEEISVNYTYREWDIPKIQLKEKRNEISSFL